MNVDAYLAALDVETAVRLAKQAVRDGDLDAADAYCRTVERNLHRLRSRLGEKVST